MNAAPRCPHCLHTTGGESDAIVALNLRVGALAHTTQALGKRLDEVTKERDELAELLRAWIGAARDAQLPNYRLEQLLVRTERAKVLR